MRKLIFAVVAAPFVVLAFQLLPMTLMSEFGDPKYLWITTPLFILSAIVYYPSTFLALRLGFQIQSLGHWFLNILLSSLYAWLLLKGMRKLRRL